MSLLLNKIYVILMAEVDTEETHVSEDIKKMLDAKFGNPQIGGKGSMRRKKKVATCLLYTSPSPRDS